MQKELNKLAEGTEEWKQKNAVIDALKKANKASPQPSTMTPLAKQPASKKRAAKQKKDQLIEDTSSLEGTPFGDEPTEDDLALLGVKKQKKNNPLEDLLGFVPSTSHPIFVPNNILTPIGQLDLDDVQLPIVLKGRDGTWKLEASYDPTRTGTSFWKEIVAKVEAFLPSKQNELFGTVLTDDIENFNLQTRLYPSLFSLDHQLRRDRLPNNDLAITKGNYNKFLNDVVKGAQSLLQTATADKANMTAADPPTTTRMVVNMLHQGPKPFFSAEEHYGTIQAHASLLAHTAEKIRRELQATQVVVSKTAENARQSYIRLECVASSVCSLIRTFCPDESPLAGRTTLKIKREQEDEDQAVDQVTQATELALPQVNEEVTVVANGTRAPSTATKLPRLLLDDVTDLHACRCEECDPTYHDGVMQRVTLAAKENYEQTLTEQVKSELKEKLRRKVQHEVRDDLWSEETKIQWVKIREELQAEVTEANKVKLRAEITEDMKKVMRKEVHSQYMATINNLKM